MQIPQKRVTKLINHHKVAAFPPQPRLTPTKWTPVRVRKTRQNKNLELPRQLC